MTTTAEFIDLVKNECQRLGVTFLCIPEKEITYPDSEGAVAGYFMDSPAPVLAVATGDEEKEWFPILVHEYCHMRQWAERAEAWLQAKMPDGEEASVKLFAWVDGAIELSYLEKNHVFQAVIEVEIDCERRVLKLIAEMQLPLDPALYARQANAYVMFHHLVKKHRRWWLGHRSPYRVPGVLDSLPSHLDGDYRELSAEHERILEVCLREEPTQVPCPPQEVSIGS